MTRLYIICGPAGVGKSTYGKKLSSELGACLLDSDTITEPVVRAGLELSGLDPEDRDSVIYKTAFRDAVYECLYATAKENLPHTPVVLVGPFTREIQNPNWKTELEYQFSVPVSVIFITCDSEERYSRIVNRNNPRDKPKLRDWEGYLAGSSEESPQCDHQVIVTD